MAYWTALPMVQQICKELGLPQPTVLVAPVDDVTANQIVALLNNAGNELLIDYPWEQFREFQNFATVDGVGAYDLPEDWKYYVDQTQWDKTNQWPLLGPKSAQEWGWIKNGLLASAPRTRYRVFKNQLNLHPIPGATPIEISIEYVKANWVRKADDTFADMVVTDSDEIMYDPWLVIAFTKLKFFELKGFDTTAFRTDFMRRFTGLTGKDKGAPKLSLAPELTPVLIGPWSVPDGSWQVV